MSWTVADRRLRCLGAAFVFQFATSLTAGLLSRSLLSGTVSQVLGQTSSHVGRMRTSIVLELLTAAGIVAMASLLYVVLRDQSRAVALVALGLWMAEAIFLAIKALALYALMDVSTGQTGLDTTVSASDRSLGSLIAHAHRLLRSLCRVARGLMFGLGIDLRPEQDDDSGNPDTGHESDDGSKRAVGLVVAAEARDVPGDEERGGEPEDGGDEIAWRHPAPLRLIAARAVAVEDGKADLR